jgi:hypothetical protein
MANSKLTFSNKGIPMGRNKSASVNASSQWSEAEDNYVRMTAEQNMPASMVAAKLGRTKASVYARKWTLGIVNNHDVPRVKAPKATKAPKAPKVKQTPTFKTPKGVQLFQLESGIPIPPDRRGDVQAKMQIRNAFSRIQVGQSFVINKEVLHSTNYIAKKEYEAYRIKTSATTPDKKFYRIFRVA